MIETVLILEDVRHAREWLSGMVTTIFPDAKVSAFPMLRPALSALQKTSFDLALVDLSLPDGTGNAFLQALQLSQPDCTAVVTTAMATDAAIVEALGAGAQGYLLKSDPDAVLQTQLRNLLAGIPALSPQVARRIMQHFQQTGPNLAGDAKLTKRETEVLTLIARGLRVSEVAQELGLAESTVLTHIKSVYRKLKISSRAEAALHASRLGLLDP